MTVFEPHIETICIVRLAESGSGVLESCEQQACATSKHCRSSH